MRVFTSANKQKCSNRLWLVCWCHPNYLLGQFFVPLITFNLKLLSKNYLWKIMETSVDWNVRKGLGSMDRLVGTRHKTSQHILWKECVSDYSSEFFIGWVFSHTQLASPSNSVHAWICCLGLLLTQGIQITKLVIKHLGWKDMAT